MNKRLPDRIVNSPAWLVSPVIRFLATMTAWLLLVGAASAFPPAPHHTLFGMVRDSLGQPLNVFPSEVLLETPSGVQLRASLVKELEPGVNYRLEVPMDAGISDDVYQPTALRPYFQFKLKVQIGQATYLPMEMSGDFSRMGQPSEETRLDLTLGIDSDGDGLPDAWEQAMIDAYGGTLDSIRPEDDLDGDGLSNLAEYLAGTYIHNPADGFSLSILETKENGSVLEFLAVKGRTYTVLTSADLQTWSPAQFRVTPTDTESSLRGAYSSSDTRLVRVEVPFASSPGQRYFKAAVQ